MALNQTIETYGSQLPKSSSVLNKRQITKDYGFAFPLGDIDSGKFLAKSSNLELVKGQLKQLLFTSRGERVMLPSYGTNLRGFLMEPLDQATFSQIRREISESFLRYAKNVSLDKLQIFPGSTSTPQGGNFIIIKLFCTLLIEDKISFDLTINIQ